VGFAPYRPYPLFRRLAPWPFGSVAGALTARSLLILFKAYTNRGARTTVRKFWQRSVSDSRLIQ